MLCAQINATLTFVVLETLSGANSSVIPHILLGSSVAFIRFGHCLLLETPSHSGFCGRALHWALSILTASFVSFCGPLFLWSLSSSGEAESVLPWRPPSASCANVFRQQRVKPGRGPEWRGGEKLREHPSERL